MKDKNIVVGEKYTIKTREELVASKYFLLESCSGGIDFKDGSALTSFEMASLSGKVVKIVEYAPPSFHPYRVEIENGTDFWVSRHCLKKLNKKELLKHKGE